MRYDVRVKHDEGKARPRWYTVANGLSAVEAGAFMASYLANDASGPESILTIEAVAMADETGVIR